MTQTMRLGVLVVGIVVVIAAVLFGFAHRGRMEAALRHGVLTASGKQITVGKAFPAIDLLSPAGAHVRYAPAKGKITVVNVFATWCPPCRAESPAYAFFAKSAAANGVDITGIDRAETAPQIEAYRQKYGLTFPYLIDGGNDTRDVLGARAMPVTIIVDARGIVRADVAGPVTAERLSALTKQAEQPL
jgi:cytochrome c biogenesis protein CcmG/thiol:disulfide interchange protein DsbE